MQVLLRTKYTHLTLQASEGACIAVGKDQIRLSNFFLEYPIISMLKTPTSACPFPELVPKPLWSIKVLDGTGRYIPRMENMDVEFSSGSVAYKLGETFESILFFQSKLPKE